MPSYLMWSAAIVAVCVGVAQLITLRALERGSAASLGTQGSIAGAFASALFLGVLLLDFSSLWSNVALAAALALTTLSLVLTATAISRRRGARRG